MCKQSVYTTQRRDPCGQEIYEKMLYFLVIRKTQIKTTDAILNSSDWQNSGLTALSVDPSMFLFQLLYAAGGTINQYNHFGEQFGNV